MYNGALYERTNNMQRRDVEPVIEKYVRQQFRWRSDGRDSLLDISCGSGSVTMDYVLPSMPATYRRLVGADLSPGMLSIAHNLKEKEKKDTRIAFELLDIGGRLCGNCNPVIDGWLADPFDHITSFYCLHWVENHRQAIRNVFDLLAPGGDIVLTLMAKNWMYQAWVEISKQPRWAPYLHDVTSRISVYYNSEDPAAEMRTHLKAAGFAEYEVQLLDLEFVYESQQEARDALLAIAPFTSRFDEQEQVEFIDECLRLVRPKWEMPPKQSRGLPLPIQLPNDGGVCT